MINIVLLVFSTDERLNFLQINFYCTTLVQVQLKQEIAWRILWTQSCIFLQTIVLHNKHKLEMIFVRMIKQQDHLLTRRTEPVGVKQDLHSLQASGKSHKAHLWYVPRFELLQNRMDTKGPVPSSIGKLISGRLLKALVFLYAFEESQGLRMLISREI